MDFQCYLQCPGHKHDQNDLEWLLRDRETEDWRSGWYNDDWGERTCWVDWEFVRKNHKRVVIQWESIRWTIYGAPCLPWEPCVWIDLFSLAIGIKISLRRYLERNWGLSDTTRQAQTICKTGLTHQYVFDFEAFLTRPCEWCGKQASTNEEFLRWIREAPPADDDRETWRLFRAHGMRWDREMLKHIMECERDIWRRLRAQGIRKAPKKPSFHANQNIDRLLFCSEKCSAEWWGIDGKIREELEGEIDLWQRQEQDAEDVRRVRSLLGRTRKAIRDNDRAALRSLRKEYERVRTSHV